MKVKNIEEKKEQEHAGENANAQESVIETKLVPSLVCLGESVQLERIIP